MSMGLALSGGGFRATLYHLGVLRFLRDAEVLDRISHITSVSGGSIIAAHLVLNWDRYSGTAAEFDAVADELLDFVRMDIRNRVVRRFPLAAFANGLRRIVRRPKLRRFTRPGILESHYAKFLYGDTCLYELPASPQLHILSTNLNEGCVCSFNRSGLLMQRRQADGELKFELVRSTLASVPLAVTASSAFPGFFPPLEVDASDVGAEEGHFPPQLFTDGGVYDNLAVRMFRHIGESWMQPGSSLRPQDFIDLPAAVRVFREANSGHANDVLHRLSQLIVTYSQAKDAAFSTTLSAENVPVGIQGILTHEKLFLESRFNRLPLENDRATTLIRLVESGHDLEPENQRWLNRFLMDSSYSIATGAKLFQTVELEFEAVIVSDAGKPFSISRRTKGGGLLGTALRSSDILMNRVWQLENDHFRAEPDFIFAPLTTTVHLDEDPTALHPEIQHQIGGTRTDLDRFSELEISGLTQHGYGVMRKVCKTRPDLFGDSLPTGAPWDPTSINEMSNFRSSREKTNPITSQARELQKSSQRQVVGRLLNLKDWPTYVFLPLLALILIGVPYLAWQSYKVAKLSSMIVDSITFSNPDFHLVMRLAQQNPIPGNWKLSEPEEVDELKTPNIREFVLTTDTRIFDLRAWKPGDFEKPIVYYRRMRVRRLAPTEEESPTDVGVLRIHQPITTKDFQMRFDAQEVKSAIRIATQEMPSGESAFVAESEFDLSRVPIGSDFDLGFEIVASGGLQGRRDNAGKVSFPIVAKTNVAAMWILLPDGHPYQDFSLLAFQTDDPSIVESIAPTYRFDMEDGSLFGWMLVAPRDEYTYDCRWTWR